MSRVLSRSTQVLIDLFVLSAALWLAFLIRFDWVLPGDMLKRLLFVWPYAVAFKYAVLHAFSVPRFSWRYVGLREVSRILIATTTASTVLLAVRVISGWLLDDHWQARYGVIPFGVIAVDFILSFLAVSGIRVSRRMLGERAEGNLRASTSEAMVPTLLIGAGQAGLIVAKELATRPDIGMKAVAFLDDDRVKHGTIVHGVPVVGRTEQVAELCRKYGAHQVLITIANAPGHEIRRITKLCGDAGIPTKIIPGIYEIVGGRVNLSRIRDVSIEDLLGREPVVLETDAISAAMMDRVVLVTGAGGSIGSELCRQLCRFKPGRLVLVEQAENALFNIHRELIAARPELAGRIIPRIADVTDAARMTRIFTEFRPEVVFHAAAHKHVPMMEWNPGEAVKNNVLGTRQLADIAHAHRVREFVMISTDKAVNPTSMMGASKRAAEIYIQALSQKSETKFVTVRFGNVLGSAGSVIPIFKEQIERGGPVTVTHPDMKRYFMTIPEACQLVLQAGSMGAGGEIFILDMGEPVKIVDLARDLIRLSGLRPNEDIEIQFSGVRPGEKLFEELSVAEEFADKTRHPKIFIGRIRPHAHELVSRQIEDLERIVEAADPDTLRANLRLIVPEYQPEPARDVAPPAPVASPSSERKDEAAGMSAPVLATAR